MSRFGASPYVSRYQAAESVNATPAAAPVAYRQQPAAPAVAAPVAYRQQPAEPSAAPVAYRQQAEPVAHRQQAAVAPVAYRQQAGPSAAPVAYREPVGPSAYREPVGPAAAYRQRIVAEVRFSDSITANSILRIGNNITVAYGDFFAPNESRKSVFFIPKMSDWESGALENLAIRFGKVKREEILAAQKVSDVQNFRVVVKGNETFVFFSYSSSGTSTWSSSFLWMMKTLNLQNPEETTLVFPTFGPGSSVPFVSIGAALLEIFIALNEDKDVGLNRFKEVKVRTLFDRPQNEELGHWRVIAHMMEHHKNAYNPFKEILCTICFDLPATTILGCGHNFCSGCAEKQNVLDCYICRTRITSRHSLRRLLDCTPFACCAVKGEKAKKIFAECGHAFVRCVSCSGNVETEVCPACAKNVCAPNDLRLGQQQVLKFFLTGA